MADDRYWQGELDDLLKLETGLTDWEVKFVERLDVCRGCDIPPSDGQIEKLHQMWDERCG